MCWIILIFTVEICRNRWVGVLQWRPDQRSFSCSFANWFNSFVKMESRLDIVNIREERSEKRLKWPKSPFEQFYNIIMKFCSHALKSFWCLWDSLPASTNLFVNIKFGQRNVYVKSYGLGLEVLPVNKPYCLHEVTGGVVEKTVSQISDPHVRPLSYSYFSVPCIHWVDANFRFYKPFDSV